MKLLNASDSEHSAGFPVFILLLIDFCLLNLAFFALNYWKRGSLFLSPIYVKLLLTFYGVWIIVSLLTKKFYLNECLNPAKGVWVIIRSGIYLTYCVAITVVFLGLYSYSRAQVFGTSFFFVILECILFGIVYLFTKPWTELKNKNVVSRKSTKIVLHLVVVDFVLVGVSFFVVNYFKRSGFIFKYGYEKLLLLIYGLWFICSLITRKFEQLNYENIYHAFWPWIKAAILMVLSLGVVIYFLQLQTYSRTQAFGTVFLLVVFEMFFYWPYYLSWTGNIENGDIDSSNEVIEILKQQRLQSETNLEELKQAFFSPIREGLRDRYLKDHPGLFAFMSQFIDLGGILRAETALRNSNAMLYSDSVSWRYLKLFINLRKINDIRYLNRYFLAVHNLLITGGYLVGWAQTIKIRRAQILKKFPRLIANGLYAVDFLINRVCPKLPWIKQMYFSITKGKNRIISRAELLGRLNFCGFEIVAEEEIEERLYFIAQKAKTVSRVLNPSYGPLVGLDRLGKGNKPIRIYKFRTMHPYSEFLQEYVYKKCGLQKGGKLKNDFRVTGWGKVMRKLWLDELPMLYNWVRGDLKLFGVRPLSIHYFSLYPKELQELRRKVKPGLVPPFYADMPVTFEEICESEKRYILAYLKSPVKTQVVYFWRAFYNIVFKGARSQ